MKSLITPKDKALGIPIMKIIAAKIHEARLRPCVLLPIPIDTTTSNNEIDELTVANNRKMKKMIKGKEEIQRPRTQLYNGLL